MAAATKLTTIVVLGASFAGLGVAHSLLKTHKDIKVVMIAPTAELYWNLASVRAIIPGQLSDDKLFKDVATGFKQYGPESFEFTLGTAIAIEPDEKRVNINTANGNHMLDYDHLVIATGSRASGDFPWKSSLEGSSQTKQLLHDFQGKVNAAKSIVIAGAGPTGVETSAEIAFEYKDKEITLINAGKTVLVGLPPSVIKFAENTLKSMNIKLVLDTKIVSDTVLENGSIELTLSNGEKLVTDLYLPTIGVTPNTEYVPKAFLNERGDVVVDEFLQVRGTTNIWAAGDVVDCQPSQMTYATNQAKALAKNLDRVLKGQKPVVYKTDGSPMLAVTLGRSKGTGRFGNMKLPSFVINMVKGKTLFTEKLPKYVDGSEF
ncbi:hypothetical protein G7Y89_g3649 [Cudoniella acicularis]|uniref:FAD/NAD(P)-binding domain-containing protein n=1 Tax=Cudoniella acicularis TaxID=354080 RepID=A0A8H4W502_9HELO|nr:hypothetical protein G7Y89_g3649 [Cudoniella acicularis]